MASSSTSQFVQIADIRGILVVLKDSSLRTLVEVESVNFDLKSSDEQVAILRGFQDFLNALDFPIQIAVRSRKLDIKPYLAFLEETFRSLTSELLRIQATEYARFVRGLSELANIMSKRFFVVIPYYAVEATATAKASAKQTMKHLFSLHKEPYSISDADLEAYQAHMEQRISLVISALSPLGLKTRVLGQEELMGLFKTYYGNT